MDSIINTHRPQVDKAVASIGKVLGTRPESVSAQLEKFNRLTEKDFDNLANEFGIPAVVSYIERMSKLGGKLHG